MRLSILDQSPISSGKTAQDALNTSIELAKLGDKLGYKRFWIAEHHDLFGLACPNPDVMIGIIGSYTERIRIGAGAVLLPYYKPFRVAETYNLLATMFPNRIDLGLGRAPGGSAEVSLALTDNYLEQVKKFPDHVLELISFIEQTNKQKSIYQTLTPTPVPNIPPTVWMLGTSKRSAYLAAHNGMPYVFGHFMSSENGEEIIKRYFKYFQTNKYKDEPEVIIAVSVICAETEKKAEEIALSYLLWQIKQDDPMSDRQIPSKKEATKYTFTEIEKEKIKRLQKKMVIGDPKTVKEKLKIIKRTYKADELMIITITHEKEDKFNSYELIINEFKK